MTNPLLITIDKLKGYSYFPKLKVRVFVLSLFWFDIHLLVQSLIHSANF